MQTKHEIRGLSQSGGLWDIEGKCEERKKKKMKKMRQEEEEDYDDDDDDILS